MRCPLQARQKKRMMFGDQHLARFGSMTSKQGGDVAQQLVLAEQEQLSQVRPCLAESSLLHSILTVTTDMQPMYVLARWHSCLLAPPWHNMLRGHVCKDNWDTVAGSIQHGLLVTVLHAVEASYNQIVGLSSADDGR